MHMTNVFRSTLEAPVGFLHDYACPYSKCKKFLAKHFMAAVANVALTQAKKSSCTSLTGLLIESNYEIIKDNNGCLLALENPG